MLCVLLSCRKGLSRISIESESNAYGEGILKENMVAIWWLGLLLKGLRRKEGWVSRIFSSKMIPY